MLYKIAVGFVILWVVGIVFGYALGGLINILLALAAIIVFIDVRRKRLLQKNINSNPRL